MYTLKLHDCIPYKYNGQDTTAPTTVWHTVTDEYKFNSLSELFTFLQSKNSIQWTIEYNLREDHV